MSTTAAASDHDATDSESNWRKLAGYRVGFVIVGLLVLATAVLIPFGTIDLWHLLTRKADTTNVSILGVPPEGVGSAYSLVGIEVIAIDEVQQLVTLRVTGYHACDTSCDYKERVLFYSLSSADEAFEDLPAAESLTLLSNATDASAKFTLPFESSLIRYPFDTNKLILGLALERTGPDGKAVFVPTDEARKELVVVMQDQVSRLMLHEPQSVDPAKVRPERVPNFNYTYVSALTFERPLYLKILVVLIVLLIATAAAYAAFLRPFDQLIINAGALVLGVYGVRSLVLGGFPPDTTAVDIALTLVAFFLLCTIAVRGLNYMHLKSAFRIPGLAREKVAEETTRKCPDCGSDIPKTARRCSFCTSWVEPEMLDETAITDTTLTPPGEPTPRDTFPMPPGEQDALPARLSPGLAPPGVSYRVPATWPAPAPANAGSGIQGNSSTDTAR